MTGNWYELLHVVQHHHQDLLREAAELRKAESARRSRIARRAALRTATQGRPGVVPAPTFAARLGRALEAAGRRLQGCAAQAEQSVEARRCELCGEPLHGTGPIGSV